MFDRWIQIKYINSMRVFVTGASGFIGSHLTKKLIQSGFSVKALIHKSVIDFENVEVVIGDIRYKNFLENSLKGIDYVFHLASAPGASIISEKEFFEINAKGTENLIEACIKNNVNRIVHISSAGVYGSVNKSIVDEDHPLNPLDPYERSKAEGERIAKRYLAILDLVIVRPGWVYGPGDKRTLKLFRAINNGKFIMVGRGNALQTPVYVDDLVEGLMLALKNGKRGEVYNIAGDEIMPVREMIKIICSVLQKKIPPVFLPLSLAEILGFLVENIFRTIGKEGPISRSKIGFFTKSKPLSIEKAKNELGYQPLIKFEKGLKVTIDWYRRAGLL